MSLDSPELEWLGPVLTELRRGPEDELLFGLDYPQYVKLFKRAVAALGAPSDKVLPYCTRHSGASVERARRTRAQEEVARRGRWANQKSTDRYEKGASLTESWSLMTPALRIWCEGCEKALEATIVHGKEMPAASLK